MCFSHSKATGFKSVISSIVLYCSSHYLLNGYGNKLPYVAILQSAQNTRIEPNVTFHFHYLLTEDEPHNLYYNILEIWHMLFPRKDCYCDQSIKLSCSFSEENHLLHIRPRLFVFDPVLWPPLLSLWILEVIVKQE